MKLTVASSRIQPGPLRISGAKASSEGRLADEVLYLHSLRGNACISFLAKRTKASGTAVQLPYRLWNGISLKPPRLSYSVTVGIFPSFRATLAQSSSTVDSCCRNPDPLGRSPAFSSAPFRPPKCLYSVSSGMRSRRRSRRLGLCLSCLAHERMAWRISTRDMALSPGRGFQEKLDTANFGIACFGQYCLGYFSKTKKLGVSCVYRGAAGSLRVRFQRPITRTE